MKRREFIQSTAAGACAVVGLGASEAAKPAPSGVLPRRKYGKTDVELSVIGFGGIVLMGADQSRCNRVVAEAVERGVNYFDVAPSYGDGEAEEKLGPALEPYRKSVFLACKTGRRDRKGAEEELARSLKRLRTDHLDLYQLHGITDVSKDVDAAFGADGVMELLAERRKAGQIRFLGFSAHSIEAATAAMERFPFDSVLFPVNFASWRKNDWGPQIMKLAEKKGAARLALKAMARQKWQGNDPKKGEFGKCWYEPVTDPDEASRALRWTLGQPVTAAIPPGVESLFRLAMEIAARPLGLPAEDEARLMASAEDLAPIFPVA